MIFTHELIKGWIKVLVGYVYLLYSFGEIIFITVVIPWPDQRTIHQFNLSYRFGFPFRSFLYFHIIEHQISFWAISHIVFLIGSQQLFDFIQRLCNHRNCKMTHSYHPLNLIYRILITLQYKRTMLTMAAWSRRK
ncbi:hypothetical protein D3C74_285160 [compost metagenome]